ncbi:MAG: PadR family transcriptional regulator [Gemmatimonadota bacterium]
MTFDNSRAILLSNVEVSLLNEEGMGDRTDLLQGTLDLLILKTLAAGPLHGWGIGKRIEQMSEDVLSIGQGSLYPALYRLEERGWISSEWSVSPGGRKVKVYQVTSDGRRQFRAEQATWRRLTSAVELVLQAP